MALGALLEEDRRDVLRECDAFRRPLRVFCAARGQREERRRRAENCENKDDACVFHFFSTALCFEIVSAAEDSETAAGSRKGRVEFRFNFSRKTRADFDCVSGTVARVVYSLLFPDWIPDRTGSCAARFRDVYRSQY